MPSYLPESLSAYVDPSCAFSSLKNLVSAAERGEVDLSAVTAFARIAEKGETLRFSRTKPILLAMKEAIESRPDLEPRCVVYLGLKDGLWDWTAVEAWENNVAVLSERSKKTTAPRKGVYLTRRRRSAPRLPRTEGMFVPKMSLDAVCSFKVSDGAKACLAVLMSIAGKEPSFTTYTQSVAKRLGRTARTVRNHFAALEEAGLIIRTPGSNPNTVRITITDACRPEPYKEADDIRAYKLARRSGNPALQMLVFSAASAAMKAFPNEFGLKEGRKEISAFNPESISFLLERGRKPDASRHPVAKVGGVTTHSNLLKPLPRPSAERISSSLRAAGGRYGTEALILTPITPEVRSDHERRTAYV